MRDISFGQYYPSNSVVHKMNPAIKIIYAVCYIVAVFMVKEPHFLGFALCLLVVLLQTAICKIPIGKMLKSVKAVIFFVLLSAGLQLFFNKNGTPLWEGGFIYDKGLITAGFITARILLLILGTSLLTFTTSPVEIADGIETLLSPLKIIKFPVHEFALIMSIALRFIPTLLDETDRIIKAQKARGANFDSGNIFAKAKALIPVLIPLLISSFRRADELADAMDARCYAGSKKRTKYKRFPVKAIDIASLIFIGAVIACVVYLNSFTLWL